MKPEDTKTCETCRFYDTGMGLCKRRSPSSIGGGLIWPATNISHWCGEYEEVQMVVEKGDELTLRLAPEEGHLPTVGVPECPDCGYFQCILTGLEPDSYCQVVRDEITGSNQKDVMRFRLRCRCEACNKNHVYRLGILFGRGWQENRYYK